MRGGSSDGIRHQGAVRELDSLQAVIASLAVDIDRHNRMRPAPVHLGDISGHSENVHNAVVEGQAFKSLDEILTRPFPQGQTADTMLADVKAVSYRA
jgi:hypothetical protein